jgi:hypothetical protein
MNNVIKNMYGWSGLVEPQDNCSHQSDDGDVKAVSSMLEWLDSVSPWCYAAGINYTFLSINHFIYNSIMICNQLRILRTERTHYTHAKTQECITCFRNYLYCF